MAEKRVTRKELLKTPDEFLSLSERAYEYIKAHSKQFAFGLVAFALAILVFVGIRWYKSVQYQKALAAYSEALASIPPEDQSDDAKMTESLEKMKKFTVDFSGSVPAHTALINMAELSYRLKQYDSAVKYYQQFLDRLPAQESHLKPMILNGMAYAHEANGDRDQAAVLWRQVAELPDETFKTEAWLNLGRVLSAAGKKAESRKAYEQLISEYPNSPFITLAKTKLAELDVK